MSDSTFGHVTDDDYDPAAGDQAEATEPDADEAPEPHGERGPDDPEPSSDPVVFDPADDAEDA